MVEFYLDYLRWDTRVLVIIRGLQTHLLRGICVRA